MTEWSTAELTRLHDVVEVLITPAPSEGVAHPGRLIWVLEIDGRVFIRSWKGPNADWYRQALQTHRAHIAGGGIGADVVLRVSHDADELIDAAYLAKYSSSEYATQMNLPLARATTLELLPAAAVGE